MNHHRARAGAVLAALTLSLLVTLAGAPAGASGGSGGSGGDAIDWRRCTKGEMSDLPEETRARMQCALVELPVDYSDPDGEQLEIFVSRRPAVAPDSLGPLFVNQGGPSAEAARYAASLDANPFLSAGFDRFDLIGMDPRGTGGSTKLDCTEDFGDLPPFAPPGSGKAAKRFERGVERFVAGCADDAKATFFGSNNVARDMDAIRERLGADQITYFGKSYGSDLGTAYVSLYPERVRAALLDGATDLSLDPVDFVIQQAAAGQRGLARYLDHCRATPCAWTEGDDPQVAWDRLVAAADEPGTQGVTGEHLRSFGNSVGLFPDPSLATAVLDAFVVDGDEEALLDADESPGDDQIPTFLAVTCTDLPIDDYPAALERLRAAVPSASDDSATLLAACAAWPRPVDPIEPRAAAGRGPIAVVSTVGDVNTPYESGVGLAGVLDAPVITWDANNHTAYLFSPCVQAIANAMLVDLVPVPPEGVVCPDDNPATAALPDDLEPDLSDPT